VQQQSQNGAESRSVENSEITLKMRKSLTPQDVSVTILVLSQAEVAGSNPASPTREIRTLQVETLRDDVGFRVLTDPLCSNAEISCEINPRYYDFRSIGISSLLTHSVQAE
jgi:hypothetical protein